MLTRPLLVVVGCIATVLAILGAILPGLPTTPFLLIALWAFARSSPRLLAWLQRVPVLKTALVEAQRFEDRRAVRLPVKFIAVGSAWGSTLLTAFLTGGERAVLIGIVALAAVGATTFMLWIPTDRS